MIFEQYKTHHIRSNKRKLEKEGGIENERGNMEKEMKGKGEGHRTIFDSGVPADSSWRWGRRCWRSLPLSFELLGLPCKSLKFRFNYLISPII